jgi:ABC-2 type transport system permease protein
VTHPIVYAARLGLSRGWTEFRHTLASPADLGWNLFLVAVFMVVLLFQRNARVDGATLPLAMLTLPGMLGLVVAMGGFQGAGGALAVEREDGTLLRAKAVPQGMVGYLVGRIVSISLAVVFTAALILAAGIVLLPDLATAGRSGWPTLLWVLGLGLLATMPWGAILGSLVKSPNAAFGLAMLPSLALAAISGIFYPITALPGWVQAVAQAFPIYWLGLGIRSALLPDAAAAVELTGSWRHLETAVVLGAWAVAGLLLAPAVLRRMARRESGSSMEARRHQHLQRM